MWKEAMKAVENVKERLYKMGWVVETPGNPPNNERGKTEDPAHRMGTPQRAAAPNP